jgi:hypothetical protein
MQMPARADVTSRLTPYVRELLDREHARNNLSRMRSRHDEKLRRQLEAAMAAIGAGGKALAGSRRRPPRRA